MTLAQQTVLDEAFEPEIMSYYECAPRDRWAEAPSVDAARKILNCATCRNRRCRGPEADR